jgi:hypothetical protein
MQFYVKKYCDVWAKNKRIKTMQFKIYATVYAKERNKTKCVIIATNNCSLLKEIINKSFYQN